MVLITGGAYSGLEEYAKQLMKNDPTKMKIIMISKLIKVDKEDIEDKEDEDIESLTRRLQKWCDEHTTDWYSLILIHEEVGCGLIPETKEKRIQREIQGRAGCFFSQKANEVYRVCCGLGIKMK